MAELEESNSFRLHVIVLPYHGQGHINPMLQFAKRLAFKGVEITFATTLSNTNKLHLHAGGGGGTFSSIAVASVYDDTSVPPQLRWQDRMDHFKTHASAALAALITGAVGRHRRVAVVTDANLQWGVEVAKKHGVPVAAFFTQAVATVACYYPLYLESIGKDLAGVGVPPPPPALPPPRLLEEGIENINVGFARGPGKIHPMIKIVLEQFKNLDQADWVLFNSFHKLEEEVVNWMQNLWPVKTIGPTIPSAYLDNRVKNDVNYGFNLYKPNDDACMSWLNTNEAGSVVYIAFGSAANLSVEQMSEIAEALKSIASSFLWVVRETEQNKLPPNFTSNVSPNKGLVVSWCPQLDVLAHQAVGCFVTHCGWNSTIKALSFGLPMLAMPQFLDQMIDAHFVERVWGVGMRPKANERGFVTGEEIEYCLKEIMQGERAEKIRENAAKWKALAKEAVDEGGSSDENINEIIAHLSSLLS